MKKYKEFLVGGAIRDEILGVKSKDLDYVFVFDHLPEEITSEECFDEMFKIINQKGEIFLSTPSCYTIRYKDKITKEIKDVVMARKEIGYLPNTRIPIIRPGTIYDDLERRDFTINALAKDENGEIIDYFNGLRDLNDMILRTPLPTEQTFNDDPLRILRAIRFSITKDFIIPEPMSIIIDTYDYETKMSVVSNERIREELLKCFSNNTYKTLKMLNKYPTLSEYIFKVNNLWLKPTLEYDKKI